MPKDVALGRELAEQLRSQYLKNISTVEFTYNAFVELETLDQNKSFCFITPQNYSRVRETRSDFRHEGSLTLTLVSTVGSTERPEKIDEWLDSWDLLLDYLEDVRGSNGSKLLAAVETEERFDSNVFHSYNRMVNQATLRFLQLIEV